MVAAAVVGVLLAISTFVAVATFSKDHPGTWWSLLLVPLVGVGTVCSGMVRARARNLRTVRCAHLAVVAGIAFLCTCVAIVLWVWGNYTGT
jgi:peptidoglycan/LPS O-acetylase OafA/YrhL